jgi:hypothetical protein
MDGVKTCNKLQKYKQTFKKQGDSIKKQGDSKDLKKKKDSTGR